MKKIFLAGIANHDVQSVGMLSVLDTATSSLPKGFSRQNQSDCSIAEWAIAANQVLDWWPMICSKMKI